MKLKIGAEDAGWCPAGAAECLGMAVWGTAGGRRTRYNRLMSAEQVNSFL